MVKTRALADKEKAAVNRQHLLTIQKKVNAKKPAKKTLRLKPELPFLKQSQICTLSARNIDNRDVESRK